MKATITVLAIAVGLAFAWAFFIRDTHQPSDTPPSQSAAADPTSAKNTSPPSTSAPPVEPSSAPVIAAAADDTTAPQPTPIPGLHAKPAQEALASDLGSTDRKSVYTMEVGLTGWGAAVRHIKLSQYHQTSTDKTPFSVQNPIEDTAGGDSATPRVRIYPFAARAITVNSQRIGLETLRWSLQGPGVYTLDLVDAQDQPARRITRSYSIRQDKARYDLRCDQRIENLTGMPVRVSWEQYAQGDVPKDDAGSMGDRRMMIAGYHDLEYNPARQFIYTKNTYLSRQSVLDGTPFWHDNTSLPAQRDLAWAAAIDRYFAAVVYQTIDDSSPPAAVPALDSVFPKLGMQIVGRVDPGTKTDHRQMVLTLTSKPIDIAANGAARIDLSLYAGPRRNEVFAAEPYQSLGFSKLIVYELGCTLCTFQPLAKGLLWFLKGIHYVVRDWAVAIIVLVLFVRLLLHPVTKKAQVNMFKMSKQMQTIQPEIEKLKKKYKNDQQKFQQEQLRLWREKGINPFNMLGCLPMFLQMPIWVALYAMLYLAIELRHQPAFYGVFQAITSGKWHFLGDLSSTDSFVRFAGEGYTINLYFFQSTFNGINVLPLLMAVVFYIQQQLTTPPPATPEAAQQQKMMKFMVLLFPVMLYSAPSGLNLYILASTFAGIVDSYIVKKHVREQEEAGTLFTKKEAKPGGFMDRLHKALETKQRQLTQQQQRKKP